MPLTRDNSVPVSTYSPSMHSRKGHLIRGKWLELLIVKVTFMGNPAAVTNPLGSVIVQRSR